MNTMDRRGAVIQRAIVSECAKRGGSCNATPEGLLTVDATFDPEVIVFALLQALRQPTHEMLVAVDGEDRDKMLARGRAVSAWQAMIDVALGSQNKI